MMLQKYQFKLRDCSHIFSCHKEVGISLAIKYKSFKFIVAKIHGDIFNTLDFDLNVELAELHTIYRPKCSTSL
jgi:hypothetical protein